MNNAHVVSTFIYVGIIYTLIGGIKAILNDTTVDNDTVFLILGASIMIAKYKPLIEKVE